MATFNNGESAASVRTKINAAIEKVDGTASSWEISADSLDLKAIAETKAETAVDVFVYDTSKDSDGGAWRKRTQNTSWYNEALNTATRGSRREFPAVAVIVAESNKVTIYDGDDPSLPMWMVFNSTAGVANIIRSAGSSAKSSVACLNGKMAAGDDTFDVHIVDFLADNGRRYGTSGISIEYLGNIEQRNDGLGHGGATTPNIVNRAVNDVAMTVLPDAPIDPATGLPVPTIAVATDGGVSVIKDDGTVVDSSITSACLSVSFDGDAFFIDNSGSGANRIKSYLTADAASDGFLQNVLYRDFDAGYTAGQLNILTSTGETVSISASNVGSTSGLTFLDENPTTPANGMVAYATSTYNTGWMPGDIKGAFLSDTDDTDLVGSGELVTNGTFDTDVSGWSLTETGTGVAEWDSGTQSLKLTRDDLSNRGTASQTVSGTSGKLYLLTFDILAASDGNIALSINGVSSTQFTPDQKVLYHFISDGSDLIEFLPQTNGGTTVYIDNISVKLADEDRSVNNNGLIVNGTVTRSPVATGADLVAYSGFFPSNYLEQPYNSDLDFGTGDFCVMGWVKTTAGASKQSIFRRGSSSGVIELAVTADEKAFLLISDDGLSTNDNVQDDVPLSTWAFLCGVRSGSNILLYINGDLRDTTAISNASGSLSDTSAISTVGYSSSDAFLGSLALLRISATAPTAEQIAKIYEDEKFLFQENAQATLYGSSDAVTALWSDPVTDLLHVKAGGYRNEFQGLSRVAFAPATTGSSISAVGGLVVEG